MQLLKPDPKKESGVFFFNRLHCLFVYAVAFQFVFSDTKSAGLFAVNAERNFDSLSLLCVFCVAKKFRMENCPPL